jgi:AraC family transcriptional regulator
MEAALAALERGLEGEVDYRRVAAEANCSTFHFLRMFEVVTGVTAAEYVRRRRLSLAAVELAGGGATVTDLALRFGYETPDAFGRAFKREFGVTPSGARAAGVRLKTWPRLSFSVVLRGDVSMEFRIEKKGPLAITGLARVISYKDGANTREIPKFWQETTFTPAFGALAGAVPSGSAMGVMGICINDMDEAKQTFTYVIGIESPDAAGHAMLPPGCKEFTAPAGTWAVFPSRGPMPGAIQAVWKRIYSEWYQSSGYEHADSFDIEV